MDIFQSLAGMVEITVTGADIAGSLDMLTRHQIQICSSVAENDVTARLVIRRRDYKSAAALLAKRGDQIRLTHRSGLYWTVAGLLRRPVMVIGFAMFIAIAMYMPTRIYFIRVEGNENVPANQIVEAAEHCGICFGASRREVRSEQMKNQLLQAMPELQWAGVNTYGCVAVITVKERSDPEVSQQFPEIASIVAARDGVVLSCTASSGNILCRPGQAVRAGEVLISAYTDCGFCIRGTLAEGEIYAQTERYLQAVVPTECVRTAPSGESSKDFSLIIGKKRINLWKGSGICDTTCGRMYKEYYITLPGGFQLPVAVAVETYEEYETAPDLRSSEECNALLSAFARRYLPQQMIAGTVLLPEESFQQLQGVCAMDGTYICTEMIGRVRQEMIGEYHGEND